MQKIVQDIYDLSPAEIVEKYPLSSWSSRDGKVEFVKKSIMEFGVDESRFTKALYRPFDQRWTYYTPKSKGFIAWPVFEVMRHMLAGKNLGFIFPRRVETAGEWLHAFASNSPIDHVVVSLKTIDYLLPLYLYPTKKDDLFEKIAGADSGNRRPNLAPEFIAEFSARLKLSLVPDGKGDLKNTFGPEDVFHYAYAMFYSPAYRLRYAAFLKLDFPRLLLTGNAALFGKLCALGEELAGLHLMERLPVPQARYPMAGDNAVENVRYAEPAGKVPGRVWINGKQYFENVPLGVWDYHIGGYQVCQKWLKDRKGRQLSYDDLTHYRGIVAALSRTIELQAEIDKAIGEWPIH